jgi:hypothetical protein
MKMVEQMRQGTITTAMFALWMALSSTWFVSEASARIPPMPEDELASSANLIIEGTVISSRFLERKTHGNNEITSYSSVVRIDKIYKGDHTVGDLITVSWFTSRWVGKGAQPTGHWDYPTLLTCERFHGYLSGGYCAKPNPPSDYSFVHYNAKKCRKNCGGGTIPTETGKVLKCPASRTQNPK